MIHQLLTDIGLSEKEAAMYIMLLRHGTQTTTFLAKKAAFNRGTAYVILHSLLTKGIIIQSTKAKIQYFTTLEPKQLINYLEHQQSELKNQKEKIQAMMGQLYAITNPLTAKPKIQFFDGIEGARAVLEDTLTSKEKILKAFLSIYDISEFIGASFFNQYTDKRIKKGYTLQAIRTLEKDRQAFAVDKYAKRYITSRKEKREICYVSEDLAFPITTYMYDNKLAIISSKEENFALIIESKELSTMQKKLFELIWNSLKHESK